MEKPNIIQQLTNKQKKFCYLYIQLDSGVKSAIEAGYAAKNARSTASKLLVKPAVKLYLRELLAANLSNFKVTTDRVLGELAAQAFLDPLDVYDDDGRLKPLSGMPENARRAIAAIDTFETENGVSKKVKFNSKIAALDTLAKYKKMLNNDPAEQDLSNRPINIRIVYAN